jgi:hypothetical protein
MPSIYNLNGTMKAHRQYQAEMWAYDLYPSMLMLHLEHPGPKQSTYERAALLKEFRRRKGISFTEWKKEHKK